VDEKILLNLLVEFAAIEDLVTAATYAQQQRASRTRDLSELKAEYEEEAAEAVTNDRSAKAQLKGKELEIKAAEVSLALKQEQLVGISDSRQLRALNDEIISLKQRLIKLEDEAIAWLEALEAAENQRSEISAESEFAAERGVREQHTLDEKGAAADSKLPHLQDELDRLLAMMPEGTRRHVLRLRKNGEQAIARIEGGACGGCFSLLPPQQGVDAERGKGVVKCAGCARFVVHHQWR